MKKGFPFFLILLLIIVGLTGCGGEQPVFFNLEISIENGNGTVDPEPGTHRIQGNSVVTISVEPAQGYFFEGWGGPDGHRVNENKILMDRDLEISAIFQPYQIVSSPEFSLEEGTYTGSQELEINSETEGAKIIFTVDGTDPSSENGEEYIKPIEIFKDTKVKAFATKEGLLDSEIVGKNYQINYLLEVEIEPETGGDVFLSPDKEVYKFGEEVQLEAIESEGFEFSQWTEDVSGDSNPILITVDKNKLIKANFVALDKVGAPIFSLEEGSYTGKQLVEITSPTEGAEIVYTLDGTIPGTNNGEVYTSDIEIYKDSLVKAIAVKEGMVNSEVVQVNYEINYSIQKSVHPSNAGTITLDPQKDYYKFGEEVEIRVEEAEGYTFNNWIGDLSGDENPRVITIEDCLEIVANFDDKLYRVTFHVNDEDGNDLEGVEILISSETIFTDPKGEAEIYLATGQHNFSLNFISHEVAEGTIDIDSQEVTKEITLKFLAADEDDLIAALEDSKRTIINLTSNVYDLSTISSLIEVSGDKVIKSVLPSKIYFHVDQEVNKIQPENNVFLKAKFSGDWEIDENRTLILDTIVKGDCILSGGTFQLDGYRLEISGDMLHRGSTFVVGKGEVYIEKNYLIEEEEGVYTTGELMMLEPEGLVIVEGNFVMDSRRSHTDNLKAGTMELRGDFTQRVSIGGISNLPRRNFRASEDHLVILNGTSKQVVSFQTPGESRFATLELDNSAGVEFSSYAPVTVKVIDTAGVEPENVVNLSPFGEAIIDSGEWLWDLGVHYNWDLLADLLVHGEVKQSGGSLRLMNGNLKINGDYYLEDGRLNLTTNNLETEGTLYQRDGDLIVGSGELRVGGNYLIEEEEGVHTTGELMMLEPEGLVIVEGNFVMDSRRSHSDNLKAGTMELRGDFTQRVSIGGTSYVPRRNFRASEDHRVILNGTSKQVVSFQTPGESRFATLELDNSAGVEFSSYVPVTVKIIDTAVVEPENAANLSPFGEAIIDSGEWLWDLGIHYNWDLLADLLVHGEVKQSGGSLRLMNGNLKINGDYYLEDGRLNLTTNNLETEGTLYQRDGDLIIGSGELRVGGNYLIEEEEGVYTTGELMMLEPGGLVIVEGNFVMDSRRSHTDNLKAGTMELRGDFTQRVSIGGTSYVPRRNFQASEDHRVILNGTSKQVVSFQTPGESRFATLELDNSAGVEFSSRVPFGVKVFDNLQNEPINSQNLSPFGVAEIENELWRWSLRVDQNWQLQHDLTIQGDLYLNSGTLDTNNYQLEVQGFTFENGGSISP